MRDIFKTARAAAFVVAACALHTAGAHARQEGAKANPLPADPPAVAPNYEAPSRELPSVERVGVDAGEPLTLTLEEAVRMALENNNDIEATRIDVAVSEHELTAARGAYDLRLTSETYFERSETPAASFLAGGRGGALKTTDVSGRFGFEGLSPRAGGSYRVEFSSRRLSSNNVFNDINPTVSHGFTLSYTQPLLRGRKTDDTRRRVEIAKQNLSLTDAQFRRRATEVVTNVEQAYWELAYALRNLQIQIDAVKQARTQAESDRRQVEKGVIAPVDLLESETQVKNFEQNVYAAQESLARAENGLKRMLAPDRRAGLWSKALLPVTPVNLEAPRVALEEAVSTALSNRLELAELETGKEINKIDQRFYRDQTRPQVDLTAGYSSNALAGSLRDEENPLVSGLVSLQNRVNQLSTLSGLPALPATTFDTNGGVVGGYGQSLKNLFAQSNPTVKVGVRVSLPWRNREDRAGHRGRGARHVAGPALVRGAARGRGRRALDGRAAVPERAAQVPVGHVHGLHGLAAADRFNQRARPRATGADRPQQVGRRLPARDGQHAPHAQRGPAAERPGAQVRADEPPGGGDGPGGL
jgi:HAE1 family hydrophobic/amphiphilic exporter-1